MFRSCHRLGAWHSIYRRALPVPFNPSSLSSMPLASHRGDTIAQCQPQHRISSRYFFKEAFSEPVDPAAVNIYLGGMAIKLEFAKIFAGCTAVSGLVKYDEIYEAISKLGGTMTTVGLCSLTGLFIVAVPIGIHIFSKKYVVEIRHNPQMGEYSASRVSLWMSKKWITFRLSDIEVPPLQGRFTTILVGKEKTPLLIHPRDFTDVNHYKRFLHGK